MLPVCCRHWDCIVLQLDVNRTVNSEAMLVTASYHHKSLLLELFSVAEEKNIPKCRVAIDTLKFIIL